MVSQNKNKSIMPKKNLSLLAQYDDFCRETSGLINSSYIDVSFLIAKTEENRIKWLQAETDLRKANQQIRVLLARNSELQAKVKNLEETYLLEVQKNKSHEIENKRFREVLNIVRKTVNEDSNSKKSFKTISSEGFHFMKSLMNDHRKLFQEDVQKVDVIPPKECENSNEEDLHFDKTDESLGESSDDQVVVPPKCLSDRKDELLINQIEIKGPSPSPSISDHIEKDLKTESDENDHFNVHGLVKSKNRIPLKTMGSNVSVFFQRDLKTDTKHISYEHTLFKKKFYKAAICNVCTKRIGFCSDAFQCVSCKTIAHLQCQKDLKIPCDHTKVQKPAEDQSLGNHEINKFCPLVPLILVRCIEEIEKRGLKEEGIYRKSGSYKEIQELKSMILNSNNDCPKLDHDVHTLCNVVKSYLKSLGEPLVSFGLWNDFVNTTKNFASISLAENERLFIRLLNRLPQSNRDVIAYIILHLKKVAEYSEYNQMGEYSLAKLFAPSIIGCSTHSQDTGKQIEDYSKQITCMHAMISMPKSFWESILEQYKSNAQLK